MSVMEDRPQYADALALLEAAINTANEALEHAAPDVAVLAQPDYRVLARTLWELGGLKLRLSAAMEEVEDCLIKCLPHRLTELTEIGLPPVEVHAGANRKAWKKDELVRECVLKIADKHGWDDAVTATAIAEWLTVASPAWKVTGLRELRIDPDEFCETTWGRKTVQWHVSS